MSQPADALTDRSNRAGRTLAMTVFTCVRPWYRPPGGSLWVRAVFAFARRATRRPGKIQELSFIHFARWGLIRRIPDHGQPRERLRRPLFMFESNYNGSFDQYIDAFAEVLTGGMSLFWGSSYGWPTPTPVARFKDYIRAHEFAADHYYSAYPAATLTMITTALDSQARHRNFREAALSLSPPEFLTAYRKLITEDIQQSVAPRKSPDVGRLRELLPWLRPAKPSNRSGRSYYFVCLTPIKAGREAALAEHLRSLNGASPLRWLPHVHFGRWVIIDGPKGWWPGGPRRTQLRSRYLLFTAAVTAPNERYAEDLPGSFLQELFEDIPDDADAIWGHCLGYPTGGSATARSAYLASSQLDSLLFYVGYPDTTVQEVRDALELREYLLEFARTRDPSDTAAFKQAYLEESTKWLPSN